MIMLAKVFFACVIVVYINCSHTFQRASSEYLERIDRTREALTENLIKFYDKDNSPIIEAVSHLSSEVSVSESEYLIASELAKFSPYYVFNYFWLNEIVLKILGDNFPVDFTLESAGIHDHLELMTLKYINEDYNRINNEVPRYIYLAILTFIHETVYGKDAQVPVGMTRWRLDFALKIKRFNLPLTRAYLSSMPEKEIDGLHSSQYLALIDFLAQLPDNQAKAEFLRESGYIYSDSLELMVWLDLDEKTELSDYNSRIFLKELIRTPVSKTFLHRIQPSEILEEYLLRFHDGLRNPWFYGYLFKKLNLPVLGPASYIFSRNLNNPFVLAEAQQFRDFNPLNLLKDLEYANLSYFVYLDIATKLVRSGLLQLESSQNLYIFHNAMHSELPIAEFILLESPKLVNFFKGPIYKNPYPVSRLDLIFETQCHRDNPLSAILLLDSVIARYTERIVTKINLNVAYRFDFNFRNTGFGPFPSFLLRAFYRKTVTFREMLKYLNDSEISAAFGLTTEESFEESEDAVALYPIHSITAYIKDPNSILN